MEPEQRDINDTPTVLLSKPNCVQCTATKRRFEQRGIRYREIDITQDDKMMEWAKERGYLQAPVVIDRFEHWSGYDPTRIDAIAV